MADEAFVEHFGRADSLGYSAFKIKVGHADFEWDLHRLALLAGVGIFFFSLRKLGRKLASTAPVCDPYLSRVRELVGDES